MIVKKELEVAQELGDVVELLIALAKTIKEKGNYADLVDELIAAISGIEDIPAETKNIEACVRTVAPGIWNIVEVFIKKDEVEPTPVQ